MNKFNKTSFPSRQPNYNNFLNSGSGSRNSALKSQIKSSTITKKQPNEERYGSPKKIQEKTILKHLETKIQIDPSLLFPCKRNSRHSTRPIDNGPKIIVNKTQSKFYQINTQKQRPKSKQEPRLKLNLDSDLKNQINFHQRPHTSKGPRPYKYVDDVKKRKMTFENNDQFSMNFKEIDRRPIINSSQSRRTSLRNSKYNFETSIDPEFLNLFAAN